MGESFLHAGIRQDNISVKCATTFSDTLWKETAFTQMAPQVAGSDTVWLLLWGYVKNAVLVPPLPTDIDDLKQRITEAVAAVTCDMLWRVWEELDYQFDICRVTRRTHIECL
jgi:hypothetical protein